MAWPSASRRGSNQNDGKDGMDDREGHRNWF